MRLFRIYCSVLIGVGFTAFVALTLSVSWMIGIGLLMPGFAVNWVAAAFKLPETYGAVLVGDALLYSGIAAVPVYLVTAKTTAAKNTLFRSAGLLTVLITVLVLAGWSGATYLDRHGEGLCQNSVDTEVPSPDGKLKAVIFDRDCGATTATAVHVSIIPRDKVVNHADVANAFVVGSNDGAPSVEWKSNTSIVVTYPAKARVFKHENRVANVNVSYSPY